MAKREIVEIGCETMDEREKSLNDLWCVVKERMKRYRVILKSAGYIAME